MAFLGPNEQSVIERCPYYRDVRKECTFLYCFEPLLFSCFTQFVGSSDHRLNCRKFRDPVPLSHAVKLYIEFYCKISEQIVKDISEKISIGELEDASETIGQMGKGFKQTKAGKPKSMEGKTKQVEQERKDGKVSIYSSG